MQNHKTTEAEKYEICGWKYEGEYSIYDPGNYDDMKEKQFCFANPKMYVESFADKGQLIGFCNLYDDGDEVFFGIGVNPNVCGKGYGTEMAKTMYGISKELFPGKPLYLEVMTWNKRAVHCYQKAGFEIDGDAFHQVINSVEGMFYRMIKK